MSETAKPTPRSPPKQERAQATYERLLDVAGNLLAEVGIDRITTNMICARAGLTPPALYRYFEDKYAVLEALGRRLMDRQNIVLERWIERYADHGLAALRDGIGELLRENAEATQSEPGAVWILRALHATPRLIHIRLESHRYVTDKLTDAYIRHLPAMERDTLWQLLRLSVELGFAADEMLQEETRVSADMVLERVTRLLMEQLPMPDPAHSGP
jgi:AcrR family transcriptional regulator